jgi:fibronectin type III domain protein
MNTRLRLTVLASAVLSIAGLIAIPRIIEAKRSGATSTEPSAANPAQGRKQEIMSGISVRNDTSKPLREMKQKPLEFRKEREANVNPKVPHFHRDTPDPVVQSSAVATELSSANMPSAQLNFNGIQFPGVACNCAPPDTVGEVGATQYVQMVNEGFQVFDKTTGASQLGPSGISTIWQGFGGVCELNGNGDPVVLYDQLADRWVISQFAGSSVPNDECVAISATSDATGAYHRYDFHLGSNFFDYPHLSVWPDAYYMSMNVFNSFGTSFLGPQPFAFDRAKMLQGLPATFVTPGITGGPLEETYLPADLDGSNLPPVGAPATFTQWPGGGAYRVFHFHADFATPANSSFTLFASVPAAGFTQLCALTRSCVPQLNTTSRLDAIADRMMFRTTYRNFGTHESVVGNYTVSSGGVAGIRWFELRDVTAGPVTVAQESTYQPDTTWRWMGSAAMDRDGNLAIGYSASSASIFPEIRYAGRLATDPPNTLAQAETTLFAGTGSQTGTSSRWGDYSALTIDPVDDCTFWFTTEYYATTSSFNWRTRIGSFKFPTCGGAPTPTPTPTPDVSPSPSPSPTAPPPTPTPTPLPVPNAPTNLNGIAVSPTQINLSWTDNSTNEDGFRIERCLNNNCTNFAQIAQVGANVTTFSNTGLSGNKTYRYRVRAFNVSGNSAYSNIITVRTPK